MRGAPHALVTAALRSPLPPPADPYTETYSDRTDETGSVTYVNSFSAHIANGATATVSGPATGPIAQTFTWKLTAAIDAGAAVRGSTYGLAAVAVDQTQGGRTIHFQTTADVAGNFAVQLLDARVGDLVNVSAADQTTHQMTTTALTVGGPSAKITGFSDLQYVRGTITPTVTGSGLDTVYWNGVDALYLPTLLATAAPFPYPLDTSKFDDGTYRLEASGRPDGTAYDYLYLTFDNTPPNGSAGADQTVARGSRAIIVTGAGDDTSGLASVKVDFGDNHRLTQSGTTSARRSRTSTASSARSPPSSRSPISPATSPPTARRSVWPPRSPHRSAATSRASSYARRRSRRGSWRVSQASSRSSS